MNKLFKQHKAMALILAYSVISVMFILSMAIVQRGMSELNLARINRINTQAFYFAEAALAKGTYELITQIANNVTIGVSGGPTAVAGLSSDYNISYSWEELESSDTKKTDKGIVTFKRKYKISGTATNISSNLSVTVNQIIDRNKTYTFQHAVFYADDLEILPGSAMTLSGKIHSNHDIYLGSNNTLTVDSEYLYSAGNIYNKRKDSTDTLSGNVRIKRGSSSQYKYIKESTDTTPLDSQRSDWTAESQNRWEGNVKSSVHGVTALATPAVASIAPNGYYANNAGLKIIKTSSGSYQTYSGGSLVTLPSGIITDTTIYNKREGQYINVTDIDIGALNSSGYFPSNGLMYVSREDSSAAAPNSVRLKNGSTLNDKLTTVTNNPLYIQGNYNNTAKKSAAVISDSVNILSSNWVDANGNQSGDPFSGKVAGDTTINVAFIAGIKSTPTGGGTYSGGLENYLRLHENWGSKTLSVRGSFVELWNSSTATGNWIYGDPYYTAPTRDWNYDSDFNNEANLPPFTPFAVEAQRIAWWQS